MLRVEEDKYEQIVPWSEILLRNLNLKSYSSHQFRFKKLRQHIHSPSLCNERLKNVSRFTIGYEFSRRLRTFPRKYNMIRLRVYSVSIPYVFDAVCICRIGRILQTVTQFLRLTLGRRRRYIPLFFPLIYLQSMNPSYTQLLLSVTTVISGLIDCLTVSTCNTSIRSSVPFVFSQVQTNALGSTFFLCGAVFTLYSFSLITN